MEVRWNAAFYIRNLLFFQDSSGVVSGSTTTILSVVIGILAIMILSAVGVGVLMKLYKNRGKFSRSRPTERYSLCTVFVLLS